MNTIKTTLTRRDAFTLVELLTVIAIIGILSVLVGLSVGKVRQSARATTCASSLRQIHAAVLLHATDNRGILISTAPSVVGADGKTVAVLWYEQVWTEAGRLYDSPLAAYAGGGETLSKLAVCPENAEPLSTPTVNGMTVRNRYGYPYVVNYSLLVDSTRARNGVVVRLGAIQANGPSTPLISDSNFGTDWGGNGWEGSTVGANQIRIGERHGGKSNVLWCDGHVSPQTRAEVVEQIARLALANK